MGVKDRDALVHARRTLADKAKSLREFNIGYDQAMFESRQNRRKGRASMPDADYQNLKHAMARNVADIGELEQRIAEIDAELAKMPDNRLSFIRTIPVAGEDFWTMRAREYVWGPNLQQPRHVVGVPRTVMASAIDALRNNGCQDTADMLGIYL